MKKALVLTLAAFSLLISTSFTFSQKKTSKPTVKLGGFTQATMIKSEDNKAFSFGFDRVRLLAKGGLNKFVDYKLQIDFMKTATDVDKDGDTPGIVKDAVLIYKPVKKMRVSVGKFKTPVGFEFNASGTKLDFVKRGLGQALVFERNVGAMVHGKNFGKAKLGFKAGVFNAGPNKANSIGDPAEGQDYSFAGSLSLNPQKTLYAEVFFGTALTSVDGQSNVNIFGAAAKVKLIDKLQLKCEFMSRSDDQNTAADGSDFYIQGGYLITPNFEPVIKYEKLDVENNSNDQANATFGLNIFLNPEKHGQSKIQINYVSSDLDGKDAVQVMFQGAF